ncbi:MAG: alpha-amylase family glycosyl hydrolase [Bacteroidota bacterium]
MKKLSLLAFFSLLLSSGWAQTAAITFKVDMSYQIELGNFDPDTDFTDIAGTLNNWGGDLTMLSDSDGDNIYEVTISGLTASVAIEFKFRINGQWDGTEEFPGGGANRRFTPQTGANEASYWYNDQTPPGTGPLANFSASEQSVQEESIVTFTNTSTGEVTEQQWRFDGGQPATSTAASPKVRYANPGSYDVRLITGNGTEADTIEFLDYIQVKERDKGQLDWWNDAVFYEIFVRSFQDSDGDGIGDFKGLIEKLDYLNDGDPNTTDDLGITGIWLMPINPSPSYHGYDVTDYKAINPDYGTMEDFETFLDAAHDRGIKVIIDFVMNHSSTQHPWFQNARQGANAERRNWYRWSATDPNQTGPWGQQVWHRNNNSDYFYGVFWGGMPDLNYQEPEVQDAMYDAADFWLTEIGIDGFRLDAVKFIIEEGNVLEDSDQTFVFWKDYQQRIKNFQSQAFSVGEAWTSTEKVLKYVENEGLDLCFEFDLAGAMINAVWNEDARSLANQIQKVYNLYPHLQFASFLSNHDQNRIMDVFSDSDERVKTAAALYLTLPGVPFVYYGEEVGMKGSKPDENIRRPMQWSTAEHGGFSTRPPWNSLNANYPLYNVAVQTNDENSILSWYRQLIHIRNRTGALRKGNYEPVSTNQQEVLAYHLERNGQSLLVVHNLSNGVPSQLSLDFSLTSLLPGDFNATDLISENDFNLTLDNQLQMEVQFSEARQVYIFDLNLSTSTNTLAKAAPQLAIFPNPSQDRIVLEINDVQANILEYRIFSSEGRLMQSGQYRRGEQLNISGLSSGLYVIEVAADGRQLEAQLMVKN